MSHLVGYLLILGLPGEEVEEVDNDPDDHCNLHVVILPVGPELNFVMVCQTAKQSLFEVKIEKNIVIGMRKISQLVVLESVTN